MIPYSYSACTRTYTPLWQQGLRRCVRLYLALDELGGRPAQAAEKTLRQLEDRLRDYLQADRPVTPETTTEACGLLEAAEVTWLGDAARCAQLRREFPLTQALPSAAPQRPGQRVLHALTIQHWRERTGRARLGRVSS